VAGAQSMPFDADATESIFEMSRGNLRAIDRLALKALELASRSDRTVAASGDVIAARKVLWP